MIQPQTNGRVLKTDSFNTWLELVVNKNLQPHKDFAMKCIKLAVVPRHFVGYRLDLEFKGEKTPEQHKTAPEWFRDGDPNLFHVLAT